MVPMDIINLYDNYNSYFNDDLKAIFEHSSKIASESNTQIYLIGGMVRDLLLNLPSLDIDITVVGNAIEFAQILEKKAGAKISSIHKDFGTVKVEMNGVKIDFASTRSESYPKKGHLPVVDKIGCTLKEDVLRRDFTVNSLAMSLNQENFADLIDYVGGYKDLNDKKIRILHDKSFIDDPTRIIRALKYSCRFGFELDENTLKLQQEYLQNINYDMGYKRIKQEFKKTFDCCNGGTFNKFVEQGIYKLITKKTPVISISSLLINKYKVKHHWIIYFGLVVMNENLEKFQLTKYETDIIEGAKCLLDENLDGDFEIYKAFCAKKIETLLILAILGKEKEVLHYLDNLQKIKLNITGKDLILLGINPSKKFSEIFDYVLKEKLKNHQMKKFDEINCVKKYLSI